jgi:hypothetical protein
MASERSMYSKIRLILSDAEREKPESLGGLVEGTHSRGHPAFLTYQYDVPTDDFVWRQSLKAIGRAVRMSRRLDLVDDSGQLTRAGAAALRSDAAFQDTVRSSVARVLEAAGVRSAKLNDTARRLLRSDPPTLPTAAVLWAELAPELGRAEFGRLLTLLADARGAETHQKKLFLRFTEV